MGADTRILWRETISFSDRSRAHCRRYDRNQRARTLWSLWLLLALPFTAFATGASAAQCQAPITVSFPANPVWSDSGVTLMAGQTVMITASGQWSVYPGGNCGPDGIPGTTGNPDGDEWAASANKGALIGFIGSDPYSGGGWFGVGSSYNFTAPVSGELWFGINDDHVSGGAYDNGGGLTATISCCELVIKSPQSDAQYPLSQNDITAVNLTYEADDQTNSGQVSWTVNLEYATSGGKGATQTLDTFTSTANSPTARTYQSQGGRLTISATEATASGTISSCPTNYYAYIVGAPIQDSEITSRLISLYARGATPNLLTGIASVESSYLQFNNRTLYNYYADWPYESYDGGSHIGLMQVPTTLTDAWDWHVNTLDGANLFQAKLATARRLERRIRRYFHGLRPLTPVQIENMALVLYGPYASGDLTMQYYYPQVTGHRAVWVVNTFYNPNGVAYADNVRASVR